MARKLILALAALALLVPAAPASAAGGCSKFERKAAKHAKKARGADKKAMALRNANTPAEKQRFNKFRRQTRKHARQQERFNKRHEKCRIKKLRGAYKGTSEGSGLPLSFTVSRNAQAVSGFRAQVQLECTTRGQSGSTTRVEELVLPEKLELSEDGHFEARTESRADPGYVVSGRVRDGSAAGSVRYTTGTAFDGEYCRSELTPWSAEHA